MPAPLVPGVAAVEIRMLQGTIPIENTLKFKASATITQATLDLLTDGVWSLWTTTVASLVSNTVSLQEVYAVDMGSSEGLASSFGGGGPVPGSIAGDAHPGNVTIAISWRTGFRGRSRRGRLYHPGLVKSATDKNLVIPTFVDALLAAYNGFTGIDHVTPGWELSVVSLRQGNDWRSTALVTPVTVALVTDATVDSQRGRLHE